jgi:small subunit ribosomal protein S11
MSEDNTVKKEEVESTSSKKVEKISANSDKVVEVDKGVVVESAKQLKKKRGKRQVFKGQAHIQSTYNNTIVTITDLNGAVLGWASAGILGFKGAKKSTPYAASQVVANVVEKVQKHNIKELQVFVKGVGGGRDSAIRSLAARGFNISLIKDITPIAHNGCRQRKPRRV